MVDIGIIASVLQIADIGLRLFLHFYTFGETVASADNSMISISKDLSRTSNVLKELAKILDGGRISRTSSPGACQMADDIAKECLSIFQELDQVLVKKSATTKSPEKDRRIKAAHVLERLRWPFVKVKIELLTSNLERHKTSLALILGAIAFDNRENGRLKPPMVIAEQRSLIQHLVGSNEKYIREFEQLKLGCKDVPTNPEAIFKDCNNSMPMIKAPPAHGLAHGLADVSAAGTANPNIGAQGLGPDANMDPTDFDLSIADSSDESNRPSQQYSNFLCTLLAEVGAPKYGIAEESRSRIKADIALSHKREMQFLEQIRFAEIPSRIEPIQPPSLVDTGAPQVTASKVSEDLISMPMHHTSTPSPSECSIEAYLSSTPYEVPTTVSPFAMDSGTTSHSTRGVNENHHAAQAWLPEDDEELLQARQQGLNWPTIISQYLPNKEMNACRKRYEQLTDERDSVENWDRDEKDHDQVWEVSAEGLGEEWQTTEAECMEQEQKTSQQKTGRRTSRRKREYARDDTLEDTRSYDDNNGGFDDSVLEIWIT